MSVFTFSTDASTRGFAGTRATISSKVTAAAKHTFSTSRTTATAFHTQFTAAFGARFNAIAARKVNRKLAAHMKPQTASQTFGGFSKTITGSLVLKPVLLPTVAGALHAPGFISTYASWCTIAVDIFAPE